MMQRFLSPSPTTCFAVIQRRHPIPFIDLGPEIYVAIVLDCCSARCTENGCLGLP